MRVTAQSVGKDEPHYPDNEDAFRLDNDVWAVADGAGGGGIYAAEWAKHLVDHVPNQPFRDVADLTNWLGNIWEPFYSRFDPLAATDSLKAWKFRQEGSYATLTTMHWLGDAMHWLAYGDAVAVAWNPETAHLYYSLPDLRLFSQPPHLLNWNADPVADGFVAGRWAHTPGQTYALLSDTLAQYVLMAWYAHTGETNALHDLAERAAGVGQRATNWLNSGCTDFAGTIWQPLTNALTDRGTFREYTRQLRQKGHLGLDDYTMIWINPDTHTLEHHAS